MFYADFDETFPPFPHGSTGPRKTRPGKPALRGDGPKAIWAAQLAQVPGVSEDVARVRRASPGFYRSGQCPYRQTGIPYRTGYISRISTKNIGKVDLSPLLQQLDNAVCNIFLIRAQKIAEIQMNNDNSQYFIGKKFRRERSEIRIDEQVPRSLAFRRTSRKASRRMRSSRGTWATAGLCRRSLHSRSSRPRL